MYRVSTIFSHMGHAGNADSARALLVSSACSARTASMFLEIRAISASSLRNAAAHA